jgi:hypothetical protein
MVKSSRKLFFTTRKLDFLTGKSVFLVRKSNFSTRKQLFHVHNLSARSNVFAKFFQPQNRDSPFSIQGCAKPRFHMGIPVWKQGLVYFKSLYGNGVSPFSYGDVSIPVSIWGSPYWNVFGSQNFGNAMVPGAWLNGQPKLQSLFPYGKSPHGNTQAD